MVLGTPRTFHKKFKFLVEIDGVAYAGFQKCSELSAEIAKIEHSEGGTLSPDKSPGRVSFTDVTLERGATDDNDLWDWFKETADAVNNTGLVEPEFERNLDIIQQARDGSEIRRWNLYRAWPTKFTAGEWDNEADENVIENVTLTFKAFDRET